MFARLQRAIDAGPRILALYYGWYGTPEVSGRRWHYEQVDLTARRIGSHRHYPALGPYDSTDPRVLEQHVRQAKAAGIDTLVCSWWGKDDQTDRSFRAMLPLAARHGLTLCPMYEAVPGGGAVAVREQWQYLIREYAPSQAFLKVGGKPVFFVYARAKNQLAPEEWADLLVSLERTSPPGVLAFADGSDFPDALLFDGLFSFNPSPFYEGKDPTAATPLFRRSYATLLERTRRFRRVPVVTVTVPGMRRAPAAVPAVGDASTGRDEALYRALWQEALQIPDAWILVNSFNQWHAGTEIEPSVEYGDTYLRLTREMAARVRRSSGEARPQLGGETPVRNARPRSRVPRKP